MLGKGMNHLGDLIKMKKLIKKTIEVAEDCDINIQERNFDKYYNQYEALSNWYDFLDDDDKAKSEYDHETEETRILSFDEFEERYDIWNSIGKSDSETLIEFDFEGHKYVLWIDEVRNFSIIEL